MNIKLKSIVLMIAAMFTLVISDFSVVHAQEATSLEEVIVTARKTEETLQDIPLSITAFSEDDIKNRSIEELDDVALLTPGLTFEDYSNGGFGTPIIRGASQFSVDQLEQNVSTFIDGIYIPRQFALDVGTVDMQRIEVVKGPQSSLYGANAFMGAINYVTAKPDLEDFSADVGVTLGTDGRQDLTGAVSFPISPGKAAVRLSAAITEFDGDWDNDHPLANAGVSPGTDDTIGGWDNDSFSLTFAVKPTERISAELSINSFEQATESRAQSRLELGDLNCGATLFDPRLRGFCGELPDTPIEAGTTDSIGFLIDPRGYGLISDTDLLRASVQAEISDAYTLSYQYGNIQSEAFSAGNSDRDPVNGTLNQAGAIINAFTVLPVGDFDYDSHELRLEFTSESGLYAMIGAFYLDGVDNARGASGYFAPLGGLDPITQATLDNNPGNISNPVDTTTFTETSALFARVSVPLMDERLIVNVEGRYTDEGKDVTIRYIDNSGAPKYEDSYFTPRLSADYFLNENQLIYLSYAEGIKAGGSNPEISGGLTLDEREYGPDENQTIELGMRNTLLGGRMKLNGTLFSTDWENLQVTQAAVNGGFFTTSIVGNLGSATSRGLEADFTFAATDRWTLNGGFAVIDASYDSGTISQRIQRAVICDDVVCAADGSIGGNDLPRSSDFQWSLGAQYDGSLNSAYDYFVRADLAGQSDQFLSEVNITTIPSRTLLGLRGGISTDRWSAELWVKNATDEEYVSNAFYIPSPFFVAIVPTWGNQRRVGLTFNYNF